MHNKQKSNIIPLLLIIVILLGLFYIPGLFTSFQNSVDEKANAEQALEVANTTLASVQERVDYYQKLLPESREDMIKKIPVKLSENEIFKELQNIADNTATQITSINIIDSSKKSPGSNVQSKDILLNVVGEGREALSAFTRQLQNAKRLFEVHDLSIQFSQTSTQAEFIATLYFHE